MKRAGMLAGWLLLGALVSASLGCASGYHRYFDCRPGEGYCPHPPLRHEHVADLKK